MAKSLPKSTFPGIFAIVVISVLVVGAAQQSAAEKNMSIPDWIRNTAGFWVDRQISDTEFISALQFLVEKGILVIPQSDVKETTKVLETPEVKEQKSFDLGDAFSPKPDWFFLSGNFYDDKFIARITLYEGEPNDNNFVSADGTASYRIVNDDGETVYTGSTEIKKDDFSWYTFRLTGEDQLQAIWEIPITDIKKSKSAGGTINLDFKTDSGAIFTDVEQEIRGLPTFTTVEVEEQFEEEYNKNSLRVGTTVEGKYFDVTVERVGFFKEKYFSEDKEYFRVDMKIKNTGKDKERPSMSGLAILDNNNNQYEKEFGGTLDLYDKIYPGVTKEGYILFEKIPENTPKIKIVFDMGYDANYKPISWWFEIPLLR